ncbi:MAG TPA: amphi-Trp domain-containing protein [Polyangiales bacterium]|nr:amphi-Trp domain-containing protein [Polyangiales bacterium]
MTERDVEIIRSKNQFVSTLRRVADALESNTPVRIQVGGKRFTVPADARCSLEHEAEGASEELELQLSWDRDLEGPGEEDEDFEDDEEDDDDE